MRAAAAGMACEIGSMTFSRMQCRILGSEGPRPRVESMVATAYAGNTIVVTLPLAGSGLGALFAHRQSLDAVPTLPSPRGSR